MTLDALNAGLRPGDDTPALITGRRTVTRGDLAELRDRYASALHAHGLRAGDTLGVAVRPGPRALAMLLSAYKSVFGSPCWTRTPGLTCSPPGSRWRDRD